MPSNAIHLKSLHLNPSESGKIEDLARQNKLEPDSAQCLFLPPFEGKRGVWLQPERTFADYMEGVRIFGSIWKFPIFKYFGHHWNEIFYQNSSAFRA